MRFNILYDVIALTDARTFLFVFSMARYTIGSGVEADHAKVLRCLGEERIRNYTFYTIEDLNPHRMCG